MAGVLGAETYIHPATGMSVPIPAGWDVVPDPAAEICVAALEPVPGGPARVRASFELAASALGGTSFRDWQDRADQVLPSALRAYLLIDLERVMFAGLPGGRRLAHHTTADGRAVVLEQWFSIVGDTGFTLSATAGTERYDDVAGLFAEVASAVAPTGAPPVVLAAAAPAQPAATGDGA